MRYALRLFLVLTLALSAGGCASAAKWLPVVVNSLGQAAQVLNAVEGAAGAYFALNPDAEKLKQYRRAMVAAHSALAAAHAAAKGGDAALREDVDAAFAEFKKLYQELLFLLGPLGVVSTGGAGTMSAAGDGPLRVPTPDMLTLE